MGDSAIDVRSEGSNSESNIELKLLQAKCEEICEKPREDVFEDKCRKFKGGIGPFRYYFNPVSTIVSALVIWLLVIICINNPTETKLLFKDVKSWITEKWTWLYIGTQDAWALFILVLYFSKYSNMKLGGDNEKPEFSDASYFTMLFAAGIGIGLFYFGVAEPIFHMEPGKHGNRYWGRYTDNQRAQDAMNLTFFHWGVHGWIVYVLIGLLLAFLCYRKRKQMTMRTCFEPILGDAVHGIVGDLIDSLSIICTMFGVCTSLGLGVIQLNSGFHRVNPNIEESTTNQIIIIWGITAIATISVITGVKVGIRRLSELCFALGCLLMFIVLFADETFYLLNVFVQSLGYYFQWFIQLGFHTDAFAMRGDAPDGKENKDWMDAWTIFYWGWWISWSPFVGMFIAKISRGRTIKEFIFYTLTVPVLYTFAWMTVFGGAGISMERRAQNLQINCSMYNTTMYPMYGADYIWNTYKLHRLSCRGSTEMWFDVVNQYGDLGFFLSVISLIGLTLYFVTSSDSGSLIIDCLSANGNPEPPVLQRIFWAVTEGATATALLYSGGTESLEALRSIAVASGLPYTFILNLACVSLWRAVKIDSGEYDEESGKWNVSFSDCISTWRRILKVVISILFPWYFLAQAKSRLSSSPRKSFWSIAVPLALFFHGWIILMIAELKVEGISYVGWSLLMAFFCYASGIRGSIRVTYELQGSMFVDFLFFSLAYPVASVQLDEQSIVISQGKLDKTPGETTKFL